jgi:hypothetical protein
MLMLKWKRLLLLQLTFIEADTIGDSISAFIPSYKIEQKENTLFYLSYFKID